MHAERTHFVSLKYKAAFIVTALLLFLSGTIYFLSSNQLKQQQEQSFNDKTAALARDYNYLTLQAFEQMVVFTEQIAAIQQNTSDFETFTQILSDSWPDLELLGNLTAIQIYTDTSANKPLSFGLEALPQLKKLAISTLENSTSEREIFCISECYLATSVPMFTNDGLASVVLVKPFTELIVTMARLNKVEIILIPEGTEIIAHNSSFDNQPSWATQITTLTNAEKFRPVLNAIAERVSLNEVINNNVSLNLLGAHYQLWDLTSDVNSSASYTLLIIDDVTSLIQQSNRHKTNLIVVVLISVSLFAIFVVLLTITPIKQVQHLIGQYPLIAMHQFDEVQKEIHRPNHKYIDEVDVLYDETTDLVDRLQRLNEDLYNKSQELEFKAMHDELTGLGNRNTLMLELEKLLKTVDRTPRMWALIYLDLDNFKQINDNLGHDAGDKLLKIVATRLSDSLRLTDVVCRLGGDEFTVILNELNNRDDIELVMNKLFHILQQPINVDGHEFSMQFSAGIYIASSSVEIEKIMKSADLALYAAKNAGRNCYQLFDEKMSHMAERKFLIEKEFERSLDNDEFKLALQPQINTATGELIGFEALIRWHYHHRDWIFPNDFIPVLEESERIVKLGQWVAKNAVIELVQLSKFKSDLRMAINLSARQLFDDDLLPILNDVCKEYDIARDRIELELTETVLIDDIDHARVWMEEAQEFGYRVAIDDFGTGYSSLSYLSSLPFQTVKLDRSFISTLTASVTNQGILKAIIYMVHKMECEVVAEGIEDAQQLFMLREMNCDILQGFLIQKPAFLTEIQKEMIKLNKKYIWSTISEVFECLPEIEKMT